MFKKFLLGLIIFISLYVIAVSCDTTEPPTVDNIAPGKRDYVWSIDSISRPGVPYLQSIWGSSPTDVWGAGFSEDVRDCLWHFDGVSWKRATEGTPITVFGNGSKIVGGIWGTAQNDVWAFGGRILSNPERTEPFVMHYNGNQWLEVLGDKNQMPDGFTDIYAIRKDNFWVSSSDHVSEYKDGVWKKYFIGENYFVQSISGIGSSVYLTAYPIGLDSLYLMKFNGTKLNVVDRTKLLQNSKFEYSGLLFANNRCYTLGAKIITAKLIGEIVDINSWLIELSPPSGGFSHSFYSNSKDIWAIGINVFPYHFNGSSWQSIVIDGMQLTNDTHLTGIWGDGKEIFICDTENNIIYHGR